MLGNGEELGMSCNPREIGELELHYNHLCVNTLGCESIHLASAMDWIASHTGSYSFGWTPISRRNKRKPNAGKFCLSSHGSKETWSPNSGITYGTELAVHNGID